MTATKTSRFAHYGLRPILLVICLLALLALGTLRPAIARAAGGCSIAGAPVISSGVAEFGETNLCADAGGVEYWRMDLTLGQTLTVDIAPSPSHSCCGNLQVYAPNVQTIGGTPLCQSVGDQLICLIPKSGRYTLAFSDLAFRFTPSVQGIFPQAGRAAGGCSIETAATIPSSVTEFGETNLCADAGGVEYWRMALVRGDRVTIDLQSSPGHSCCGNLQVYAPNVQTIGGTPVCQSVGDELICLIPRSGRYTLAFSDLAFRFTPLVVHTTHTTVRAPRVVAPGKPFPIIDRESSPAGRPKGSCAIEVRRRGGWLAKAITPVSRIGVCRAVIRLSNRGVVYLRVRFRGGRGWASATSRVIVIRIR